MATFFSASTSTCGHRHHHARESWEPFQRGAGIKKNIEGAWPPFSAPPRPAATRSIQGKGPLSGGRGE